MNIEIHKPELVQRLNDHIQTGHFPDAAALIEKALDALDEKSLVSPAAMHGSLHELFMNSPLRGANLDLTRAQDYPRALDLE
jgi:Arc/MetJ-type ribon-helix-helix transcriptional regulator